MNLQNSSHVLVFQRYILYSPNFINTSDQNIKKVEEYLLIYKIDLTLKKKLLQEGHIEKLNNCSDEYFISSIIITVKRDKR